jgi:hypothetical protein
MQTHARRVRCAHHTVHANAVHSHAAHVHAAHAPIKHAHVMHAHIVPNTLYVRINSDTPTGAVLPKPVFCVD